MRSFVICAAAAALAVSAPAYAATVVNIDGTANASLDGSNGVDVALAAGTYTVTFTQGQFDAFSRFSSSGGCDANGGNCVQGFENSARIIVNGVTTLFGDGSASGGLGPISGGGYFDTAARSFANAAQYTTTFTLASAGTARFFLYDDALSDNRGGVSLSLAGVPEPATWGLMILGFGAVGGAMRRRQSVAAKVRLA